MISEFQKMKNAIKYSYCIMGIPIRIILHKKKMYFVMKYSNVYSIGIHWHDIDLTTIDNKRIICSGIKHFNKRTKRYRYIRPYDYVEGFKTEREAIQTIKKFK